MRGSINSPVSIDIILEELTFWGRKRKVSVPILWNSGRIAPLSLDVRLVMEEVQPSV